MTLAEARQKIMKGLIAHFRAECFARNRVELDETDAEIEARIGPVLDEALSKMLMEYVLKRAAVK
jgi:hypothetical protein